MEAFTIARDVCAAAFVTFSGLYICKKIVGVVTSWNKKRRLTNKWKVTPLNVVILHRFDPGLTIPSPSPFVLKLETFLRMNKIEYEIDTKDPTSTKGKSPWITLNGEDIADSEICMDALSIHFSIGDGGYRAEEKGVAIAARVLLEEHFYFGFNLWRFVQSWSRDAGLDKVSKIPSFAVPFVKWYLGKQVKKATFYQGIGRHSEETIVKIMGNELRAVAGILNGKQFILGDKPCREDCAVFGQLAQCVWGSPGSPYEKLLNTELTNLYSNERTVLA